MPRKPRVALSARAMQPCPAATYSATELCAPSAVSSTQTVNAADTPPFCRVRVFESSWYRHARRVDMFKSRATGAAVVLLAVIACSPAPSGDDAGAGGGSAGGGGGATGGGATG